MKVVMKYLPCILTLLLILAGCGIFGAEEDKTNARISVEGVDGVRFGDTPEEVVDKLGPYDGWSIADGLGRAWHVYRYESGPQAGLWIYLMEVPGIDERGDSALVAGPVDFFSMRYPYHGRTSKGIGIGSTREAVKSAYGEPVAVGRGDRPVYCLGRKNLTLVLLADTVSSLHLQYFKPLEGYDYCSR